MVFVEGMHECYSRGEGGKRTFIGEGERCKMGGREYVCGNI